MKNFHNKKTKGFTLIEMIVAVSIFIVVVVIAAGALLSVIQANRKAQSIKSVVNNINFAVEGMARSIRVGSDYSGGGSSITFLASDSSVVTYRLHGTILQRDEDGGGFISITSPEVTINRMSFTISGEEDNDDLQPQVIIIVQGHSGENLTTRTDFNIQTTVSQRLTDS